MRGREGGKRWWRDNQLARWDNERRYDKKTRRRESGVSRGDATTSQRDERTRGRRGAQREDKERQCVNKLAQRVDKRVAEREDGERQCDSWRDKTTRVQRNERTARGDATTSWRDKTTRGQRNERTTWGHATTSSHDKRTPGWCDERRPNLVVFPVEMELTGEVAAMVIACVERKPERLGFGDEL
jgi:hypothetical protein